MRLWWKDSLVNLKGSLKCFWKSSSSSFEGKHWFGIPSRSFHSWVFKRAEYLWTIQSGQSYLIRPFRSTCRMLDLFRLLLLVWLWPIARFVLNLLALIINRRMVTHAVYVSLLSKLWQQAIEMWAARLICWGLFKNRDELITSINNWGYPVL